jgi:hypothetical protein
MGWITGVGVSAENLEIASGNIGKGIAYDPCRWWTLRRSLDLVSLRPEGYIFVDIGSGKGKVLLSAIILPFEQVVGIEFSSYLSRVAERNIAAARFIHRRCLSVQLMCADVVEYQIPERPTVFFANPFHYDIMELVLDKIVVSYLKIPRSIFLIFYGTLTIMPADQRVPVCEERRSRPVARIDNPRPGPTKRQYFRVAAKLTTILCEFRAALVAKSTFDRATGQ